MLFAVVHAPLIESIEISQGYGSLTNTNSLVVGRGETRTLTFTGKYLQSAGGRTPKCFYTATRMRDRLIVQRLES